MKSKLQNTKLNNTPKITVVLPTYNGAKWLAESIQSIIDQTEKNWNLIVVNDCSTDDTVKIAQSFSKKDNRISVISNKTNKKLPASLNVGFEKATGKYFTWTSDDNLYKPNALKKMATYLDSHPKTDMVSMNEDFIDEEGNVLHVFDKRYKHKRCAPELLFNCNVGAAFMYRKTIADKIGKYDEFTFCAEDYDYWCRIALAGKIDYTTDNIYQYRVNSQSLSALKKTQVNEKTIYIKKKYAEDFFKKFNFTKKDRTLFWAKLNKHKIPKENFGFWLFIEAYRFFIKIMVLPLFWHARWRRGLRQILVIEDTYSFSEKKESK